MRMTKMQIKLPLPAKSDYPIFIGRNILGIIDEIQDRRRYSKVFIITDKNVAPILLEKLRSKLSTGAYHIVLAPGEKTKDIASVRNIWQAMHKVHCDRETLVINLGGGVISDIGGFAASTYMKGVDFLNIPTTLLAQVDAGIGDALYNQNIPEAVIVKAMENL